MTLITVVGSGRVGTSAALQIAMKELGDIVLIDIVQGLPQGEALDLNHACATLDLDVDVKGSNDYRDMAGSDVVVVTAGLVRKPDMTRLDLLFKNSEIISSVAKQVKEHAPKSKVIVVTNPLDVMTYVAYKTTGFESRRVMGFSGLLDIGRFRHIIRSRLGVSYKSIRSMVLGEHGDSMVLLPSRTYIGVEPLSRFMDEKTIAESVEATRKAGAEVIKLKGWSAHHAPGAGAALMVSAIVRDEKAVIPTSAYLEGQYGERDIYAVVPCVLGAGGVEKIIELSLSEEELRKFKESVKVLREAVAQLKL
ncbi:MAG: malate dehydrogenase [Candidatus Caldarchaeum sp.]|nr:malate dehydrogenase [Candidatus Caldarchaeum sp.]MDW7977479.1 malate dehydrogenase [Candidatus Caldarchaeum sp.]